MQINFFTFSPVQQVVELALYTEKHNDIHPELEYADECPELWQQHSELADVKSLFYSHTNPAECKGTQYTVQINLNNQKQRRIAKHIIRQQLYNHFRQTQIATFDKIDNVEVWVKKEQQTITNCTEYLRFSLIPQYAVFSKSWELVISFNGISTVYNKPLSELDLQTDCFKVVVGGEVVKYKNLTLNQKQQINNAFPKINRELMTELHINEKRFLNKDKYTTTYNHINNFVRQHLLTSEFQALFTLSGEMFNVPEERIGQVAKGANLLQFKDGKTGIDPYSCVFGSKSMDALGIYQPSPKPQVKFFFIAQKSDVDVCSSLYNIFSKGYKPYVDTVTGEQKFLFPPLATCIKQMFNTERNSSIYYPNLQNALSEIKSQLNNKPLDPQTQYVAIYVSPIPRDAVNGPYYSLYYQIKELLLEKRITSQVIYKDRPNNQYFNFHLPNIATAILAKIGGIPWQLNSHTANKDLVIGVGAFLSEKVGERYVGSAFSFNPNGLFKNFDCCKANDLESIVAGIRKAIGHFVVDSETNPQRLIIHYYKTMSKREARPITQMLNTLGLNIPVLIVTINNTETSDIVMFDEKQQGYMPLSGTVLKIRNDDFLLCNNSRYKENEKCDMLFPVRIRLSKINNQTGSDIPMSDAFELLNQVYQFSRMYWKSVKIYWKSVKQQNLPITIKYPEMVAEIVPHFSDAELPQFGKNNLWFL